MGSARARKRRNRAIEAQFEKTHRRRAQFAPGTAEVSGTTQKRQRPDDGLSRDMRKMLSMKRAMENRKRKGAGGEERDQGGKTGGRYGNAEDGDRGDEGSNRRNDHNGVVRDVREEVENPQVGAQDEHRGRHKHLAVSKNSGALEEENKPLSASKQRKKEYMRNKKKARGAANAANNAAGQGMDRDEHDMGTSHADDTKKKPSGVFGEQVDAPMKEVLRSKHWAAKPAREGIDPAVSVVGLGTQMGTRRVAAMDSRAIAALYRNQKKHDDGGGLGSTGASRASRATLKSLKQLVAQGKRRTE